MRMATASGAITQGNSRGGSICDLSRTIGAGM